MYSVVLIISLEWLNPMGATLRFRDSTVLLLEDAIAARKLFYKLESTREVLKRDIKNEQAW